VKELVRRTVAENDMLFSLKREKSLQ